MRLSQLLRGAKASRRPNVVQLLRRASRFRDDGRFEEAAELVASGLKEEPDSVVGHLLAGSLHAVFREMHLARASFERVLAIDPTHPRALLGMARIALEEGDRNASAGYLQRALARYPDFPEATALLDVVTSLEAAPPPALMTSVASARLGRLRAPAECREVLVVRADGALLAAQPRGSRTAATTARLVRICRLAGAMLGRVKLGGLTHAVLEGGQETRLVRTDGTAFLALLLPREPDITPGLVHLERVWANCAAEIQEGAS